MPVASTTVPTNKGMGYAQTIVFQIGRNAAPATLNFRASLMGTTVLPLVLIAGLTVDASSSAWAADHQLGDIYVFQGGSDGVRPSGGLIKDKEGELYGTTEAGGTGCNGRGCGTVYKLVSPHTKTTLYSFQGGSDGWFPTGGLVRDKAGNLYGTTLVGGASGNGTVFKIASGWFRDDPLLLPGWQ
ncbi:MAG: choice-of-anchor tandem repeat GloVer-containing protein [Rhizomicrobium sp.]